MMRTVLATVVALTALAVPAAAEPARPGDLVAATPVSVPLLPARAWQVRYRSTNATGGVDVVSGTVLVPRTPWTGRGSRPVVGFAVGTQGLADRCAASAQLRAGTEYETPQIAQALARGWAVAVTDYPGLGTPGEHPYVVTRALGRAVLDSVRAARRLPGAGLAPDGPVAIYGWSEGGGAAGGAIEQQPSYAPDVRITGAVVGAAPSDFDALLERHDGSPFAFLLAYAASGFTSAYPDVDLDPYLTPLGRQVVSWVRTTCIYDAIAVGLLLPKQLARYFTVDPRTIPAFRRRMDENELGRVAPRTPVLVSYARQDEIMPFAMGQALFHAWCARGADARFLALPLAEHVSGAVLLAPQGMAYLADRFAGKAAPDDCP
ncbi:lipase family protein [Nocardioides sp. LML1-1-1.1]|uniref:lipase family protein n=1 Tax=Nocardioides sp. LML1-1-1.1 TaxID=3135248 RepID=UPI0034464270